MKSDPISCGRVYKDRRDTTTKKLVNNGFYMIKVGDLVPLRQNDKEPFFDAKSRFNEGKQDNLSLQFTKKTFFYCKGFKNVINQSWDEKNLTNFSLSVLIV